MTLARVEYYGGPLCGKKDTAGLAPSGRAPEILAGRYVHADACHGRGAGEAHIYEWQPHHTRGHRPIKQERRCHTPYRPGCPLYVTPPPPEEATSS